MAERWWVNDDTDNDWNNANNWSATEGGAGGAGVPTSSDVAYFSDTSSSDNCTLSANSLCSDLYADSGNTGGTDDWSGTLNLSTYDLDVSSAIEIPSGVTLTIGSSSNTGLTAVSITFVSGATVSLAVDSQVYCESVYSCANAVVWSTNDRGHLHWFGTGNYSNANNQNRWYSLTIDASCVLTLTSTGHFCYAGSVIINGTLALGVHTSGLGAGSVFTIGASGDISGSGTLNFFINTNATYTDSNSGTHAFTGTWLSVPNANQLLPTGDWRNSSFYIADNVATDRSYTPANANDIRINDFTASKTGSHINDTTIINSVFNNNWYIYGSVDLQNNGSGGTTGWTRGTGSINSLPSGTETYNWNGAWIEDWIINGSGTAQLTSTVATDSLTITAGELDIQTNNCLVVGSTSVTDKMTIGSSAATGFTSVGITFNLGSEWDLQADSDITNSGNLSIANGSIFTTNYMGLYVQIINANLSNPHANNVFKQVTINTNITGTLTGTFRTAKLIMAANATMSESGARILAISNPTVTDPIDLASGATINSTLVAFYMATGVDFNQKALSLNSNLTYYGRTTVMTMTGNLICNNLVISGDSGSTTEGTTAAIDLNGNDLSCSVLKFGSGAAGYLGKISFGEGSHTITGDLAAATPGVSSGGFVAAETASIEVQGDIDLEDITWTAGTETITLTGNDKNLDSQGNSIGALVVNKTAGQTVTLLSALSCISLTGTQGIIDFNSQDVTTSTFFNIGASCETVANGFNGGTFNIGASFQVTGQSGDLKDMNASSAWTLNISGTSASATYVNVSNSDASGGTLVAADDGTNTDSGGNDNWRFIPFAEPLNNETILQLKIRTGI